MTSRGSVSEWKSTACILCECNCGIEVQLGGEDGRRLLRVRGDDAHPISQGYACEKPSRLDFYQNGPHRLTRPLRRRSDGSFEEIDWETAIREVAARLAEVRDAHGGESIFYYGGGGQGNHLPGAYGRATRSVLGMRYQSSALAQEKTGEIWVQSRMLGGFSRSDFERCEVAIFLGKNPWFSHSIPRARVTLREIANDPGRTLIVIDPRRSETAEIADIHLQVKPGADAFLLAALIGVIAQEGLLAQAWLAEHSDGLAEVLPHFERLPVAEYCAKCGVSEPLVRTVARRIAAAQSVAVFEDLGVQMNRHSTLVSYLHQLLVLLTGNFGKPGAAYRPTTFVPLASESSRGAERRTPVTGARIIGGLTPCNVIPEEILTDHPKRFRALLVESGNPAHSLADSARMREAIAALELVVVIDVAFTETARLAHYVLPVASQFEKAEATFFNFEFPRNYFHLRKALMQPLPGLFSEAELHSRLVEALGAPARRRGRLAARGLAGGARGVSREVLRAGRRGSASDRGRAGGALPRDRRPAARGPGRGRGRLGALPDRGPAPGAVDAARRLRRRAGRGGRRALRRAAHQQERGGVLGRRLGGELRAREHAEPSASSSRCRSCSTSSTRWRTSPRPAPAPSFRSCSPPASGAPSPPTPSSATRSGAGRTARRAAHASGRRRNGWASQPAAGRASRPGAAAPR